MVAVRSTSTGAVARGPSSAPAALPKAQLVVATQAERAASASEQRPAGRACSAADRLQDGYERVSAPAARAPNAQAPAAAEKRPILLYNDQCQVCRLLSGWVKAQDAKGKDLIDERPIGGDPEALLAIHPDLDIWKVYETIHLVMPDGTLKKGGAAIGEVLKKLPPTGWLAPLLDLSIGGWHPFQKLLDAGYVTLDKLRPAIGCESCGGGPVKWWALPVKWTADAVRAIHKLVS